MFVIIIKLHFMNHNIFILYFVVLIAVSDIFAGLLLLTMFLLPLTHGALFLCIWVFSTVWCYAVYFPRKLFVGNSLMPEFYLKWLALVVAILPCTWDNLYSKWRTTAFFLFTYLFVYYLKYYKNTWLRNIFNVKK